MPNDVSQYLKAAAGVTPDKIAVILADNSKLTFGQLDQECDRYANYFELKGIRPGMRVVVFVRPGFAFVPTIFGLFRVGAIPICIDPGMKFKNVLACLREAKPEAIVGPKLVLMISRFFQRTFSTVKFRLSPPKIIPGIFYSSNRETKLVTAPTAAILFTSGSTGVPKGVVYTHEAFEQQMNLLRETYQIGKDEVDLVVFPLFALFSAAWGITAVIPKMNPARPSRTCGKHLAEQIERYQVTHTSGSPAIWKNLVAHCEPLGKTLPTLKRILMAGAQVPEKLVYRCSKIAKEIHTPYGATEALPISTISETELFLTYKQTHIGKGTCVGKVLPGMALSVLPFNHIGAEVKSLAPYEMGELVVKAPWVTKEYFNQPEANRLSKILTPEGTWHRMGDVGYLDESGRVWFCGRKDHRIFTEDGTLYPDPVEAIFDNHPKVSRSALVGVGPKGKQKPVLVIESEEPNPELREELRVYAEKFASTRSIQEITFEKHFPVDIRHNIKIDRLKLAKKISMRVGSMT